ncbi:Uncharacterized membrane protein [Sphingomonas laterariae]|uniref:Uncharacterized membrane protein n=1 Tax=Edaphosphingomonas laterariae TaxID=861865 RepID=A0A239F753_9SPHN|nr:DUF2339 domain-containing protein [Sphingomonas laterariae]SNS52627.1 Uncharacterized membrane protein [Sphingomonas laterariae]
MIELLAIVGLIAAFASLAGRVRQAERRITELQDRIADLVSIPAEPQVDTGGAVVAPLLDIAAPLPSAPPVQSAPVPEEPEVPATPPPPPAPPAPKRPPMSTRVFEELFGSRLPIWAGGVTLAVAGFFLVKYSIDTGLLSPGVRVVLALIFAALLIGGAEAARRIPALARDPRVAQALAGAGIATAYIAVLIAHNLYGLIPSLTAFLALASVTAAAIGLALRFGAPSAVLGLIGGLAAPALAGGEDANAPVLALYLMLVIGAIAGVSRRQGWLWLAIAALVGGFGWAGLLIATSVIDIATASAIGLLLLALAFAMPILAAGTAAIEPTRWLRAGTVIAAAVQLALLIVQGGFSPLVWGFYGLLAIGAVLLARIDPRQWMLPPIALGVALVTIALWPTPSLPLLAAVGGGLIAILAGPALVDAWDRTRGRVGVAQGSAALIGAVVIGWLRFPELLSGWGWGLTATIFAAAPAIAAARGWTLVERHGDWRFALLATASATLVAIGAAFALPDSWLPPVYAAIACALAYVARRAEDDLLAWAPRLLALIVAAHLLLLDLGGALIAGFGNMPRLLATAMLFAIAGHVERGRLFGAGWMILAALVTARLLFNLLPDAWAPTGFGLLALGLAWAADRLPAFRGRAAALTLALLATLGACAGLIVWLVESAAAIFGTFVLAGDLPTPLRAMQGMALPMLSVGALLLLTRAARFRPLRALLFVIAGAALAATAHILFKQIFAIDSTGGIIAYAFAERVVATQALAAIGLIALWRRDGHDLLQPIGIALLALAAFRLVWFDLIVFNPLARDQAVGPWPIANLLLPAYGLPILWIMLFRRLEPDIARRIDRPLTGLAMALILMLAAASVRQIFEGSILTGEGVSPREDIARSIAGIALAIGFLRYGIIREGGGEGSDGGGGKAWRIAALLLMLATAAKVFLWDAKGLEGLLRIASFVALGFSLIGIGFLYNRYLTGASDKREEEGAEAPAA